MHVRRLSSGSATRNLSVACHDARSVWRDAAEPTRPSQQIGAGHCLGETDPFTVISCLGPTPPTFPNFTLRAGRNTCSTRSVAVFGRGESENAATPAGTSGRATWRQLSRQVRHGRFHVWAVRRYSSLFALSARTTQLTSGEKARGKRATQTPSRSGSKGWSGDRELEREGPPTASHLRQAAGSRSPRIACISWVALLV